MPRTWFKDMQEIHKICQLYRELTPIIFINLNMKKKSSSNSQEHAKNSTERKITKNIQKNYGMAGVQTAREKV